MLSDADNVTVDAFEYASSGTEVLTIKGADSGRLNITNGINLEGSGRKLVIEGGTVNIQKSDTISGWVPVVLVGQYVQHGGTVNISASKSTEGSLYGVYASYSDGDCFVMDGGSLDIGIVNAATGGFATDAVSASGNVNISGGNVTASALGNNLVTGLEANKNVTISGGTVSFSGESTNTSESGAKQGYGIRMNDAASALTVTGGNITAIGESKASEAYGLSLRSTAKISNATLKAKAKSESTGNDRVMGIHLVEKDLVLDSSTLNVEAETNAAASYGLYLNKGSLLALNSDITVTSTSTTGEADGICKWEDTAFINLDKTTLDVNASGPMHLTGIDSTGPSGHNSFTVKNHSKVTVNLKSTSTGSSTGGKGIYLDNAVLSLADSELKVVCDITNNNAYGIQGGSMTMSGESSVDAEVKSANSKVRAIDLNDTLTMTGTDATLHAKVPTATQYSYALRAPAQSITGFNITQPEGGVFNDSAVCLGDDKAGEVAIKPPAPNHLYVSTYVDDSMFLSQLNDAGFLVKRDDKTDSYQKGKRDFGVRPNSTITLSAQTTGEGVYAHYELAEWHKNTYNGELLSTDATYTHTMGDGNETIVAVFKPIVTEIPQLTLSGTITKPVAGAHPENPTISVAEEGAEVQSAYWADASTHASMSSDAVFEYGKEYELRIVVVTEDSYHAFANSLPATLNGEDIGADSSNRSIRVKTYKLVNHTLMVGVYDDTADTPGYGGTFELPPLPGTEYNGITQELAEDSYTLKAKPGDGYRFTGWKTIDGTLLSSNAEYSFNLTGDMTLQAHFAKNNVADADIAGLGDKTYNGSAQTQNPTVKIGNTTLASGTDYSLSYSNNTNAGTATVTIAAKAGSVYTGSVTKAFKINPAAITSVAVADQTYTGSALKPTPAVKAGSLTVPASGYAATYSNNTNAGTATVTVTGKGNFTGTKSATFKISKPAASSSGSGSGGAETPPAPKMGADGTAYGAGASSAVVEAAVASLASEADPKGTVFGLLQAKASKVTKTSVKLSWKKASGAKSFTVYGCKCGKTSKYQKIATTSSASYTASKIAGAKLKKGTYYKFLVVALDSQGSVVSTSKVVHAATKGGKVGNVKKVTTAAKKNKATIKQGKTFKLKAKQVAASKKLKVKKHRKLAYESSDKQIATVSSKGVIKGLKAGTCYVYAYAQNGVCAKVKVTVKATKNLRASSSAAL